MILPPPSTALKDAPAGTSPCLKATPKRKGEPTGTELAPEVSVSVRVVIVLDVTGETIRLKLSVPDTLFCVA